MFNPAVRFGSFPENARFAPVPNLNGSVRFVSPVRFGLLFLTVLVLFLLSAISAITIIYYLYY